MKYLRQLVGALLVLAVAAMMPGPLLACAQMGHRCGMMMEQPAAPAPAQVAHEEHATGDHDCCPKKKDAEVSAPKLCHETAAAMPADCTMSSRCCEMSPAPVTNPGPSSTAKKIHPAIAVVSVVDFAGNSTRSDWTSFVLASYTKPVFELKTDLRI